MIDVKYLVRYWHSKEPGDHPGKPSDGVIDLQILTELTEFPFHSVRTLASALKIPRPTVWVHLQKGIFVVKHFREVPHTFDVVEKRTRVTMSEGLLKDLEQARHQGWHYFLTGDESWFFYATDFERMWVPDGQMPQSRPRTIVSTPKVMVSIFWSPIGFPVMIALPPKTKFTSAYFCNDIIPKIVEGMPFDVAKSPRKLMLHMDNATPHQARASCEYLKFSICNISHDASNSSSAIFPGSSPVRL
jgi:hypothetical protein